MFSFNGNNMIPFFGGSVKSMFFLNTIWEELPNLVNDEFNNNLDKIYYDIANATQTIFEEIYLMLRKVLINVQQIHS